jgi:deoxyribonuclease-4
VRLGAHVSLAGSLAAGLERAVALGCECAQIFVGNPRQWRAVLPPADQQALFRQGLAEHDIHPVVAHAAYVVNLASPRSALRRASVTSLVQAMRAVTALGGMGVVTHVGSAAGGGREEALERVARSVREVLSRAPEVRLLLENSAGTALGADFGELRAVLDGVEWDARVGVCLDTAHLFGAGFDVRTSGGVRRVLHDFDRGISLDRLWVLHLNDSKTPLGSRRDRHENIGRGEIGPAGFRALLRTRALGHVAGILEVPGFDGRGPDRENLEILRVLAGRRSGAPRARRVGRGASGCGILAPGTPAVRRDERDGKDGS